MNPFSRTFLSNCSLVRLWVARSKRLHNKASQLKTRKAFKDQEEILTCALQNGCSKIGKIPGKSLCWSLALETLPCNFIKTGLHRWDSSRELSTLFGQTISQKHLRTTDMNVLICLVSQIIIASSGQLSKGNKKSTVIAFTILVKYHRSLYQNLLEKISDGILQL